MQISSDEMQAYRAAARRRELDVQEKVVARYHRAWDVARQAARVLRDEFGAVRVAVFGSYLFHARSDVDLAVWGMDEKRLFRAVGQLLAIDPDIKTDVILAEHVSGSFLNRIEEEGVAI